MKVDVHPTLAAVMSEVEPGAQKDWDPEMRFGSTCEGPFFMSECVMSELSLSTASGKGYFTCALGIEYCQSNL